MNRGGMGGITLIFTFLIFASLYRPVHDLKYLSRHKYKSAIFTSVIVPNILTLYLCYHYFPIISKKCWDLYEIATHFT